MTWHIVRKDLRLLWPLAALVAIALAVNVVLQTALGHFGEPPALAVIGQLFPYVIWLSLVLLIAAAVHQDALPGVAQDWLVRPIRRRDLLQAKVLFVLITAHMPMLLADLAHGAAVGFSFAETARAAVVHAGLVIIVLEVPVFAIATLTHSATEVLVSFVAMWLVVLLGVGVGVVVRRGAPPPFASTGMQWMTPFFWSLVAVVAALAVVPLQYFRRATRQGRMVVAGALIVAPTLSFSSWNAAFSVQKWLSPKPDLARTITVGFEPSSAGPFADDGAAVATNTALLPILIAGAEPDSIVASDRTLIRLIDDNGDIVFAGTTTGGRPRDDFNVHVRSESESHTRQRIVLQRIVLPEKIYSRARSTSLRAELDYSLTLFQRDAAATIAATNGSSRSEKFGWCRTQIDQDGDDVEVGCLALGGPPPCVSAILENPLTGRSNPERLSCVPDYMPFPAHAFPDALSRFSGGVKFRDPQGLMRFPVDGSQLGVAQVRLTSYQPVAHFTRHVVIPELRPTDWMPSTKVR